MCWQAEQMKINLSVWLPDQWRFLSAHAAMTSRRYCFNSGASNRLWAVRFNNRPTFKAPKISRKSTGYIKQAIKNMGAFPFIFSPTLFLFFIHGRNSPNLTFSLSKKMGLTLIEQLSLNEGINIITRSVGDAYRCAWYRVCTVLHTRQPRDNTLPRLCLFVC